MDLNRVSIIFKLCRAIVRPVSVFSISRSASSGRNASVAPQVGMTLYIPRWLSRAYLSAILTYSEATRKGVSCLATSCRRLKMSSAGTSLLTTATILTLLDLRSRSSAAGLEGKTVRWSVSQSRPVIARSKLPLATCSGMSWGLITLTTTPLISTPGRRFPFSDG